MIDGIGFPPLQPGLIAPDIAAQLIDLGGGAGTGLSVEGIGIGLGQDTAVLCVNGIFIGVVALKAGDKSLPHAAADGSEGVIGLIPVVEISHDAYCLGIGGPHTEDIPLLPVLYLCVRSQILLRTDGLTF